MNILLSKIKSVVNGCWLVNTNNDYGRIKIGDKLIKLHRLSYLTYIGNIKPGMYVCHKCDNRGCINPFHLFLGSQKDNITDCIAKGRFKGGRKLKNNHIKYNCNNPSMSKYVYGCRCDGCREKRRLAMREYRAKQKTSRLG